MKKKKSKALPIFILVILVLVLIILGGYYLLRIREVRFEGSDIYSHEQLMSSCGVNYGDKMYGIDKKEIARNIIDECPYVKSVRITRDLPGTLIVRVEEYDAGFYAEVGGEYFVFGENLIVLERLVSSDETKEKGLIRLEAGEISYAVVGQELIVSGSTDRETLKRVMSASVASKVYDRMTILNIKDKYDIFAVCDDLYKLMLGDSSDVTLKLDLGGKIMSDEMFAGNITRAQIDLTDPEECGVIVDNQITFD
ncbi:MAG: FtsQ-type POTRA domain-containing protein [Clostridia bacterium]|nr:FtsQ-type POTRA domain-containing protein [Clostridia bacterium]